MSSATQDHITHQLCNDLFCSLHVNHKLSHTKSIRTFTTVCLSFLSWDSLVRHIVTKRALIYIGLLENPCLYHYCITSYLFFHKTIQVNEAEAQKEESWLTHQKMYKAYQDVEKKAREMQSKLRNTIQKAR